MAYTISEKNYLKFLSAGFMQCIMEILVVPDNIPAASIKSIINWPRNFNCCQAHSLLANYNS